jgi:type IV pilus assembly protein PilA
VDDTRRRPTMMSKFRASRERDERGFTLIELLVVILIIAILAAIAIPVFLNQRQKGYIADVQSTLRNAATAAESFSSTNGGSYAGVDTSEDFLAVRASDDQDLTIVGTTTDYCIEVTDARLDGNDWGTGHFDSEVGRPETGACPAA